MIAFRKGKRSATARNVFIVIGVRESLRVTNRMVGVARYVDVQFDPAIAHLALYVLASRCC